MINQNIFEFWFNQQVQFWSKYFKIKDDQNIRSDESKDFKMWFDQNASFNLIKKLQNFHFLQKI